MKYSTQGYKNDSPDKNEEFLFIPSSTITMKGVTKPLTLIPIIGGKPQYNMRKIAHPGDPDIDFGKEVTGVIEIPYAQGSYSTIGNPYPNMGAGVNYGFNTNMPPVDASLAGYNYNTPQQVNPGMNTNLQVPEPNFNARDVISAPNQGVPGSPPMVRFPSPNQSNDSGELTAVSLKPAGVILPDSKEMLDANLQQSKAALDTKIKQQQKKGRPYVGAINPYGGYNMQNASVMLGASIQDGNALGIIGSAGKIITEGTRNAFSGAAAMKRFNESQADYLEADAEARRTEGEYWATSFQEGGKIPKKNAGLLLTGNFLQGNDNHPSPIAEVERGEYLQTPDGNTLEVIGKKHSEGGELVSVPENTKVISDYNKIGGELATYFKKNYNLNLSAGSTFATVLDKYKKKIGLMEVLEEEAKIMGKIADQDEVEFDGTRDINLQILSKKNNEIQAQKAPLDQQFNEFTNLVFEKQEELKAKEGENFKKQEGGEIASQQEAPTEEAPIDNVELIIQQFAEITGQNPQTIVQQLQQLSDEQLQQALQQMVETIQQQQSSPQESSEGGTANIEQLIQTYAQLSGQDPNQIIEQLQSLDESQAQQMIQEMVTALESQNESSQPEAMQKGGRVPKYQTAENPVTGSGIITRVYDENFIPTAITLGNLDYDPKVIPQGISSMEANPISGKVWNPLSQESLDWFIKNAETQKANTPNYKFDSEKFLKDVNSAKTREAKLEVLNKYQGDRQQAFWDTTPQDVRGYVASGYAPTQTGVQNLLNTLSGTAKEKYVKLLKDQGVSIKDNKILGGFYKVKDNYDENSPIYKFINDDLVKYPKAYDTYTSGLINDKFYDRRMENFRKMEFASIKERDEYAKKQGFKEFKNPNGAITWVDSKDRNNIIKPVVYRDKEVTPEELKKYESEKRVSEKEGYKPMINEEGVYERWVAKGTEEASTVDENGNPLTAWNPRGATEIMELPMAMPDQSNLPPIYLQTSMRQVKNAQADRVFLSPEENLKELSKQTNTASNNITASNPYTSAAALANLQAQQNNSTNQAIGQTTLANQQDERNVSTINEERIMNRDKTNLSLQNKYEMESIVGLDNYYSEYRNFIDNRNKQNVVAWNLQNQQNMFNAINPNFKLGSRGQVYQTDEPFIINLGNGQLYDTRSKQVITQKTTSPDGKTVQTTQTTTGGKNTSPKNGKKGGMIITTSLLDLLK